MTNYRKLTIEEVHDSDSLQQAAYDGKVIIEILIDEELQRVCGLTSYAIDSNCESYFGCYVRDKDVLKDSVIIEKLVPSYRFKEGEESLASRIYVDIYSDDQNVVDDYIICSHFKKFKESDGPNYHKEVYLSKGKCDMENFGGPLELEFIEEWVLENGVYTPQK